MRKNNLSRNKDKSVTKSDDIRQQIASDGIINAQALKGNGNYSVMSDGTAFVNDDSANAFEKHEEALLAEHNAAVDEKIIEWTNKYEEMSELVKSVHDQFKDIGIYPGINYVLVKPFTKNPFSRLRKLDNGFIIPEFDPHFKSRDTGDYEEMKRMSIFAMVIEVSPECTRVKKGDIVMYNMNEGVPIPFYDQGFEVVSMYQVKCIIANQQELEERFAKAAEKKE